ncbi:hypothetical protein [Ornithinimicrobium kibberense]|uniref:hypothetical protein n=1 Tax=Ornithinimicrobium kibberense TaxID=282060 RepID=UPI003612C239
MVSAACTTAGSGSPTTGASRRPCQSAAASTAAASSTTEAVRLRGRTSHRPWGVSSSAASPGEGSTHRTRSDPPSRRSPRAAWASSVTCSLVSAVGNPTRVRAGRPASAGRSSSAPVRAPPALCVVVGG